MLPYKFPNYFSHNQRLRSFPLGHNELVYQIQRLAFRSLGKLDMGSFLWDELGGSDELKLYQLDGSDELKPYQLDESGGLEAAQCEMRYIQEYLNDG